MPNFRSRYTGLEIMDDRSVPADQLQEALADLRLLNRYLGGHRASTRSLGRLVRKHRLRTLSILDVATGAGDYPVHFVEWGTKHQIDVNVTAVDINDDAIRVAKDHAKARLGTDELKRVNFAVADALNLPFHPRQFDVCTAALFFHHLSDEEATTALRNMRRIARYGVLINDIHRSPIAYYGLVAITRIFRFSSIVRHDGPVSVLRSFTADELRRIADDAGVESARTSWRWAFRWVLTDL